MAEIYRVEKGSEEWKYKAYDYVRTDAFCCGQNIPIELEFGQDESKDDLQAILLTEDHKLEAMYKAFAKALSAAARHDDRIVGVLSTKGSI